MNGNCNDGKKLVTSGLILILPCHLLLGSFLLLFFSSALLKISAPKPSGNWSQRLFRHHCRIPWLGLLHVWEGQAILKFYEGLKKS